MVQYNNIGILSVSFHNPYSLKTIIDNFIPFVPWMVFAYVLFLLYPLVGLAFIFYKKIKIEEIISLYMANILLWISSFVIYLIFPTSAQSVMINTGQCYSSCPFVLSFIHKLYAAGVPYNAFPSLHVAPLVFISIFLFYKSKKLFWISLPFVILICSATVLIKFHFFVDILGGIIMGYFAYYVLYKKIVLKYIDKFI